MREITITVPGPQGEGKKRSTRPPGGNALHRMTHWQVKDTREVWRTATMVAASIAVAAWERKWPGFEGMAWEPLGHAQVGVTWRCKVRRRRDWDNLIGGLKPILDGLVGAGIIRDDSTDCLMLLSPLAVEVGTERDEIVLHVRECGPDGLHRMEWKMGGEDA